MKKALTLSSLFFLIFATATYAQTSTSNGNNATGITGKNGEKFRTKWKTDPFDDHVFIENKGQFDGIIGSDKVLYGVSMGSIQIYFTNDKVVYRYSKKIMPKSAAKDPDADPDALKNAKHEVYVVSAQWANADKGISIEAKDLKQGVYAYRTTPGKGVKANGYRQIIYKNIYQGIDAVYQFVEGKTGIKYSLIVHPGADISKIKINYSGDKSITKNKDGDITINGGMDLLMEHAPVTNYLGEAGNIPFSNVVTGNVESFKADANYDNTKTIIIDPWVTDPLFTGTDKAYDLDWDYHGNVYAYGGNPTGTLQLVKMNSAGAIQWTYSESNFPDSYYGDIAVDKVTGTIYVEEGFGGKADKVNTNGTSVAVYPGEAAIDEFWRADYDACNGDIVIGGGGTNGDIQAAVLDTNMTSLTYTVNVMNATAPYHDVTLQAIDPNGSKCYMASACSSGQHNLENNIIMQLPLPSLSPTAYYVHEHEGFTEVSSVLYTGGTSPFGANTNAMNGAAASPSWLYLYNGDTLSRYHKNTGAITTQYSIRLHTPFQYGGLAVDPCDNLFVGVQDSIYVMDSTYALDVKIPLSGYVFDVQLGQRGALYACGAGFVTQITDPITPNLISSAVGTPTSCSSCNGTATVNVNCGISPYTFLWSNGNTNETATGLCAGAYTVVVTDAACPPSNDTAVVSVSGSPGYFATISDTNPNCGLSKGSATAYPVGGNAPYTYLWSNGSTNQKDTGLISGIYTCIITDNSGCRYSISVTLVNPSSPTIKVVPVLDSICSGTNIGLLASGGKTYSWSPSTSLTCNTCANPTASPTSTITYTVIGTDSLGCTASVISTIKVLTSPKPIISGDTSICVSTTDVLTVTGGTTYVWNPGGSTSSSITVTPSTTTVYTVTANNGICSHDTIFKVSTYNPPVTSINPAPDTICLGENAVLAGSGAGVYKWSNGATTTSITVSPTVNTRYYLRDSIKGSLCLDTASVEVIIRTPMASTISPIDTTICPNQPVIISVTASGESATYKWSNGASSSSITVQPSSTTTYSCIVAGEYCNHDTLPSIVTVIPLPKPVISGTNWKCKGIRDTLSVSDANGGSDTYLWYNGKTTTSITTGAINADSITSVTAYNSLGCSHDTTFGITLRHPDTIKISPPATFCAGTLVKIWGTITGTPLPSNYLWSPGGETTDTITVSPTDTLSYVLTVSNGCKTTKSTILTPNYPLLYACCSQTVTLENDTATPTSVLMQASGNSAKYAWSPAVTCLNPPLCDSIKVAPTPSVTTTYTVIGTDSNGCETSQVLTITVDIPCFNLVIPNVFTPTNGGVLGLDKVFYIKTDNINGWSITIFDRWGKQMFSTTDQYKYWDGTTEGGGNAPSGVYYYAIHGTCQSTTYTKDGFVQLIR